MPGKHISILVHFVWSTAGRHPWISPQWNERLYGYIGGILQNKRCRLLCAGGLADHIHLYVSISSTIAIADAVNAVKTNSSRWIHETFQERRGFAWQKGYGAFTLSRSSEQPLMDYIRNQEKHHRKRSFKEEFIQLLRKHQVDYDERYLWD